MTDNATDQALRAWGEAKRRINGRQPPPKSIFGRIAEEGGAGAAIRGKAPPPPEVLLGVALEVGRAKRRATDSGKLSEKQNMILDLHYIVRAPVKVKAYRLGVKRSRYYELLSGARCVIRDHLEDNSGDRTL